MLHLMPALASGDLPLLGAILEESAHPRVIRDAMRDLSVEHEVEPLTGELRGVVTGTPLGGVNLAYVRYGLPTRIVVRPTGDAICWNVPLGPTIIEMNGRRERAEPNGVVLNRDGSTVLLPAPYEGAVVVTTSEQRLRTLREELTGEDSEDWHVRAGGAEERNHGLTDSAWRHIGRMLAVDTEPTRTMLRSLEQTLLAAMLLELPASRPTIRRPATRASSAVHADRAITWARVRLAQRLSTQEWAAGVGISVRHLQKVFRDSYECTPGDYLLAMRLTRARYLLESTRGEVPVADIANQVGLRHLGRFASAYREKFDELPSQTMRREG